MNLYLKSYVKKLWSTLHPTLFLNEGFDGQKLYYEK